MYGKTGCQYAADARLYPREPSASTCDGNRPVLAICAILICFVRPCCAACRQNVAKSGGIGNVLKISTPADLNWEICEEKSVDPS